MVPEEVSRDLRTTDLGVQGWLDAYRASPAKICGVRTRIRVTVVVALSLCSGMHTTATTVLVFVSPQEAVIAADSLSNRLEGGHPRLACKIVQVSDHMLFAATGIGAAEHPPFDPYGIARISSTNSRSPHEAALKYESAALGPLTRVWRAGRSRYMKIEKASGLKPIGGRRPHGFVFVGLDHNGNVSVAGTDFVEDSAALHNLRAKDLLEFTGKNSNEISIVGLGVQNNVPSEAAIQSWIYTDKMGVPAALKRGIELQVKATPKLVGPPISIVRFLRDGSIEWVSRGICQ
jgi:hypothetical protein